MYNPHGNHKEKRATEYTQKWEWSLNVRCKNQIKHKKKTVTQDIRDKNAIISMAQYKNWVPPH